MKLQPDSFLSDSVQSRPRRFQISVRMLIVLVACSAAGAWAMRPLWDPVLIAVGKLGDSNPTERIEALGQLTRSGRGRYETVIPPITQALADSDPSVRIAATEALVSLGSGMWKSRSSDHLVAGIVAELRGALNDPEVEVKKAAIEGLATLLGLKEVDRAVDRRSALNDLIAAFNVSDTSPWLGPLDSDALMSQFISILADPHDERRPAVLALLAHNGVTERFAPPKELIAILHDPSAANQAAAVRALGGFHCRLDRWIPMLFRLLAHHEPAVQEACGVVFARVFYPVATTDALPALVDGLSGDNRALWLPAAQALLPMAKDARTANAIPALIRVLRKSVAALERAGDRASGSIVVDIASTGELAKLTVRLLGEIAPRSDSAAEAAAVIAQAARCKAPGLQVWVAGALAQFNRAGQSTLIALLQNADSGVRRSAALALEDVVKRIPSADPEVAVIFAALAERLGDDDADVRVAVLEALGAAAPGLAAEPPAGLANCLAHKSAPVRRAAIIALAQFSCGLDHWLPTVLRALEQEPEDRVGDTERVLQYIRPAKFSAQSVPDLVAGLGSRHRVVRSFAARHLRELGRLGSVVAPAVPELIRGLARPFDTQIAGPGKLDNAVDFDPRRAIIEALAQIAPETPAAPEAVQKLAFLVKDDHSGLSGSAIAALRQFGTEALPAAPLLIDIIKKNTQRGKPCTYTAVLAATTLAEIAPETPAAAEAVALLTDAIGLVQHDTREITIKALAAFGPEAKRALPQLRELQTDADVAVRSAVEKAITSIDVNR